MTGFIHRERVLLTTIMKVPDQYLPDGWILVGEMEARRVFIFRRSHWNYRCRYFNIHTSGVLWLTFDAENLRVVDWKHSLGGYGERKRVPRRVV